MQTSIEVNFLFNPHTFDTGATSHERQGKEIPEDLRSLHANNESEERTEGAPIGS